MLKHSSTIRVRYSETDQMGFVYYGQYAAYLEVGRVETMRHFGIEYAKLESEHNILMPVVNLNVRYLRPVHYDSIIRMETIVRKFPERDMIFHTEIFNEQGKLSVAGRVTLCFLKGDTHERVGAPEFVMNQLKPHFV